MIGKLACAILALTTSIRADEATDKLMVSGVASFCAAFRAWDGERFADSADHFGKAVEKDPQSAQALYWQGVALFHRMLWLQHPAQGAPRTKDADAVMETAIRAFESSVAKDPRNAEAHALLGTLYGMKIKGGMIAAIRYGPQVREHQQQALTCGATNPRVLYLLGAGQLHTASNPAARQEALDSLLAAEKLFAQETKTAARPLAPRWGYSSCLTFIGKAHEALGKPSEALAYYRKARAMHPADHAAADGIKRLAGNQADRHER